MKAARFYEPGKPLFIEEVPIPEIKPNEVLLDVKANGICGSDLHILDGITPVGFSPIILGHEMSGIIVKIGSNVNRWKIGERVCSHCIVSCGLCWNCRNGHMNICPSKKLLGIHLNGGMAEYCAVPANMLVHLPDHVPFDIGAITTDAVATPYHALMNIGKLDHEETVAIFGLGGLGYHAVKLAKLAGASKIIAVGISPDSLKRAKRAGADYVINGREEDPVEAILEITSGGVDISCEFVGFNKTIDQAVRCTKIGGRTVIAGIGSEKINTLPPTIFVRNEKKLFGSYSYTVDEIDTLIKLVASGKLDLSESITERVPLEQANIGLQHLRQKISNPIRIVITQY